MKHLTQKITLGFLSVLTFSAVAADVNIYGKANVSLQSSDEGEGSFTEVKSNASRIGLKGTHKINDELKVIYQAEFGVDLDGDSAKGDSITDRNQYVGLAGNFGEILVGKNDTMLRQAQGKAVPFNDLSGDIKVLWAGKNRLADTVSYKTPSFNNFKLGVTYIAEDSVDGTNGVSVALFYGDAKLKKTDLFASIAVDSKVKGYDIKRATIHKKFDNIVLGAIYQTEEKVDGTKGMDGYMLSAKYIINDVSLNAQYQTADYDDGQEKFGISVGADYKLDKSTKLYTFYTTFDMDQDEDRDYLAVGIEYKF